MNILMIAPHPKKVLGGMSTVINNYYSSNLKDKVNIKHISTTIGGNKLTKMTYFLISLLRVLIVLLTKKIDIVHIHSAARGSFIRKSYFVTLSKIFGKKVVFHMHGGAFHQYYLNECDDKKRNYISKILNKCDVVIALGDEWKEKISGYCDSEVVVLHNAIDIPGTNQFSNDSTYITLLARLEEDKGTFDILKVVKEVCSEFPYVKFVFAGSGDANVVKQKADELGISQYINVLGWIDHNKRDEILKNTIIYLLPSYYEGMPMSILEAMSYGVPVISTNVGSIPTVVKDYKNGFIIEPGNINDLKKYILLLLNDEKLRSVMSNENYRLVSENYNIENNVNKLFEIYTRLIKSSN
ncbi:glycosyltransferase family 4 protein [Clostridium paridis]|uniref:Glycosyltransferase family 4 protein n=1 Tax=Clostridium paridis TaxID=2803863 RepID=A0A937FJ37_9CLOT|nr:glycosyltransferase family 4 protein [Clostridium paridis]MBL4932626.1 glycosyltransferase family 4 protein [Clostridium paridis]